MTFWIRHLTLLILCVVVPLGAALYVDTASEISRAERAGATAAKLADRSLSQSLRLDAHQEVGRALVLAREIGNAAILDDLGRSGRRKDTAVQSAHELLAANAEGGFVWLIDAEGRIVLTDQASDVPETPRVIVGHPLFRRTQQGFALDGFWDERGKLSLVSAAPVVKDGRAEGAVLIARTVNPALLKTFASSFVGDLTVVSGSGEVTTTLDPAFAKQVVDDSARAVGVVHGGRLTKPLESGVLPFLPVLVDKYADGLAYSSYASTAPSNNVRWILSVPSADPLRDLARRQEVLIGVLVASLMLALLVGLVNYRTFVSPIDRVAEHLSAIQLGRGEAELPERNVSRPFRRLVRLINMMMQKMPPRPFSASTSLADGSPISELPGLNSADLQTSPLPLLQSQRPKAAPPPEAYEDLYEPADLSTFPPAPASPPLSTARSPIKPPPAAYDARDEEEAAVAEAIASMSLPQVAPSEMDDYGGEEDGDSAAAIAEAIASLEAQQNAAADAGLSAPPQPPRSAASIRGAAPQTESPFMPSQSEYFRAGSLTSPRPTPQPKFYIPPEDSVSQGVGLRGGGSLTLDAPAGLGSASLGDGGSFGPEETVVAPVQEELLAKTARDEGTGEHALHESKPDATVVASVPADLLAQSAGDGMPEGPSPGSLHGLDAADHAHFKQVYERFIDMRRKCGEATADLAFDRFLVKLTKNRENLIKKYNCRTVRFQVYEKDGKAALKATPVRAR